MATGRRYTGAATSVRSARPPSPGAGVSSIVLVEGASDQAALGTLAARRGHDLAAEGVRILSVGGATNVGRFLAGCAGRGVRLTVLCDQAEEGVVRRAWDALERDSAGPAVFVCVADLEEELIRAAGIAAVLGVVAAQGEDRSFAALCRQPAHRHRPVEQVLRRFLGSRSGRKATYARLLAEVLPLDAVPAALDATLAAATSGISGDEGPYRAGAGAGPVPRERV